MGAFGEGIRELGGVAAGFGNSVNAREEATGVERERKSVQIWERRRRVQPLQARKGPRLGRSLLGERATSVLFRLRRKGWVN